MSAEMYTTPGAFAAMRAGMKRWLEKADFSRVKKNGDLPDNIGASAIGEDTVALPKEDVRIAGIAPAPQLMETGSDMYTLVAQTLESEGPIAGFSESRNPKIPEARELMRSNRQNRSNRYILDWYRKSWNRLRTHAIRVRNPETRIHAALMGAIDSAAYGQNTRRRGGKVHTATVLGIFYQNLKSAGISLTQDARDRWELTALAKVRPDLSKQIAMVIKNPPQGIDTNVEIYAFSEKLSDLQKIGEELDGVFAYSEPEAMSTPEPIATTEKVVDLTEEIKKERRTPLPKTIRNVRAAVAVLAIGVLGGFHTAKLINERVISKESPVESTLPPSHPGVSSFEEARKAALDVFSKARENTPISRVEVQNAARDLRESAQSELVAASTALATTGLAPALEEVPEFEGPADLAAAAEAVRQGEEVTENPTLEYKDFGAQYERYYKDYVIGEAQKDENTQTAELRGRFDF